MLAQRSETSELAMSRPLVAKALHVNHSCSMFCCYDFECITTLPQPKPVIFKQWEIQRTHKATIRGLLSSMSSNRAEKGRRLPYSVNIDATFSFTNCILTPFLTFQPWPVRGYSYSPQTLLFFPLAHGIKREYACACIEGSGEPD